MAFLLGVTVLIAIGLLISMARIWPAGDTHAEEDQIWRWMVTGALLLAGSGLAGELFGTSGVGNSLGGILACAPFYHALIRWNRTRTRTVDPGDWLNGLSSILVLVAFGNLIAPWLRILNGGLSSWQLQVSLFGCATTLMLFLAAATISVVGGLLRDRRIWLVVTAMGCLAGEQLIILLPGMAARELVPLLGLLAAAAICLGAVIKPVAIPLGPSTSRVTIVGALLVLLTGVGVLAFSHELTPAGNRPAILYALGGVLGASVRILRLVQDLAQLAQSRREAMTDELTGIANRRALLMAIEVALAAAGTTCLLIVDLDRFKEINDRHGHAAGDEVLRHVAGVFLGLVPAGGLLARLGGDEFAVLLPGVTVDQAVIVARSLARAAAPLSDVKGQVLKVGASVGVATSDRPGSLGSPQALGFRGSGGEEMLRRADTAMYRAKVSGSGVQVYDQSLDAAAQERLDLIGDLHLGLAGSVQRHGQIVVYFQPQFSLATGAVVGAEALARWQHPRLGLLAPAMFIDLAEDNGLMPGLTALVLREAATQAARWRAAGHGLRVSVNLSASCLGDPSLLGLIDEVLGQGMPAQDLVLEVTETSLMTDPEPALRVVKRIAERGVGISIDDYGTGYSSLRYLNDLPATELKIDRSFIAETVGDARTAAIVAATVELAHRLGMRLVAEGVEDETTLSVLRTLGCDESQGYLHGGPMPPAAFLAALRVWTHIDRPVIDRPVIDRSA